MFYVVTSVGPRSPPMYCDFCHVNICQFCVVEHLSDESEQHYIVTFKNRRSTSHCEHHETKICELHCKECNVPICALCVSSGEHDQHKKEDILETFERKRKFVQRDLQDLETVIYPAYEDVVKDISIKRAHLDRNSKRLVKILHKQGQIWHREIDLIIKTMQSEINGVDVENDAAITEHEMEINNVMSEVKDLIKHLRMLLDTSNICLISQYNSGNEKFRVLPDEPNILLPTFIPHEINSEQIYQQFGFLSEKNISRENSGAILKTPGIPHSSSLSGTLVDESIIISDMCTAYQEVTQLHSVSCLNNSAFWVCGGDSILKLYNQQGKLLESVQTKSKNWSWDIAVTQSGDLVYTDPEDRSINIVKNTRISPMVTLRGWRPCGVCSTTLDDILVSMVCDEYKQAKVVRYSNSEEIQTIQYDCNGLPLFSAGLYIKYLSENSNLDICVSDHDARAVVVVSAAGKLRFRYTGVPCTTIYSFSPYGITTDRLSNILISDGNNNCIHVLDLDGQFLHYIDYCDLDFPWGLSLDTTDNLFVVERDTRIVKKIQYYERYSERPFYLADEVEWFGRYSRAMLIFNNKDHIEIS